MTDLNRSKPQYGDDIVEINDDRGKFSDYFNKFIDDLVLKTDEIDVSIAALETANTVGVSAYLSTDEALAANTIETLKFQTENWDIGGDFDNSTGVFTAPVTGYYRVSGVLRYIGTAASDAIQARVYKEGSTLVQIVFGEAVNNATQSVNFNAVVQLDATETAEVKAFSSAINSVSGTAQHTIINITLEHY